MSYQELCKALALLDELLVANPQPGSDEIEEQIALIEKLESFLEGP